MITNGENMGVENQGMNPRYEAFVKCHGSLPNYEYMAFISFMVVEYAKHRGVNVGVLDRQEFLIMMNSRHLLKKILIDGRRGNDST